MSSSNLKIKTGGTTYDVWQKSCHIKRSMNNIAGTFAIMTDNFHEGRVNKFDIKIGGECEILLENKVACTGYIDDMNITYDKDNHRIELYGRDKTADLIDCAFTETENEWKNLTVSDNIEKLCTPFGIEVVVEDNVASQAAQQIVSFKADEGEFISDIILRLCRENAILPMSYGDGKLTLTKASTTEKANDDIQMGSNALYATVRQSNLNRYRNYIVKGYGIGSDDKSIDDYINPFGEMEDNIISRNRTLMIFAEGETDSGRCTNRAKWEASIRAGMSRMIEYKVDGWTQSNGDLWDINTLVNVKDKNINLNETMLIVEIDYVFNEDDGLCSFIKVVNKNTYNLNNNIDIKMEFENE